MGNSLTLAIQLESGSQQQQQQQHQGIVQAGDVLRGKVVVTVQNNRNLRPGRCAVHLRLYGKEKTRVRNLNTPGGSKGPTINERQHQFFYVNLSLRHPEWRQEIRSGATYVLPFAITLPASLPATDNFQKGQESYRIQYKIQACVGKRNMMENAVYVRVRAAPLPDERVPCVVKPKSYNLNSLKVFPRGQLTIAASVQDTHIGKGEYINLNLACRNDSTADLRQVTIKVVEHCRWGHSPPRESSQRLFTLHNVTLPGVEKDRKDAQQVRQQRQNSSHHEQGTIQALHRELATGRNVLHIKLPATQVRDTYYGRLVHVSHVLIIDFRTEMTVTNPSISIPLRIGNPPVRRNRTPATRPLPRPTATAAAAASAPPGISTEPFGIPTVAAHPVAVPLSATLPVTPSAPPEALVFAPALETVGMEPTATIPIVQAICIPADAAVSDVAYATDNAIFLGDDAVFVEPLANGGEGRNNDNDSDDDDDDEGHHLSGRTPLSALFQSTASLETLQREMLASINDYDIISRHLLENDAWRRLLSNLSPTEFGSILACVHVDFDQPRVALLLAHCRDNHNTGLTCAHVAAAIRNTADWNRTNMVQKLLPLCVDAFHHEHLVRNELNEWERTVTQADFDQAALRTLSV